MTTEIKLDFKPITSGDSATLKKYFEMQDYRTCAFTVGSAIMWQKLYNLQLCESENTLTLSADYDGEGHCFSVPIGKGDFAAVARAIYNDCKQKNEKCIFSDVPESALVLLRSVFGEERVIAEHFEDWDDYVYEATDLIEFAGKKFSAQRNNVNKFSRACPNAVFEPITRENFDIAAEFLKKYVNENCDNTPSGQNECCADLELIDKYFDLDLRGAIMLDGDKVIAISIGEKIGDTLFIHVEKALTEYHGIYQAVVQNFAKMYATDVKYINREEDDGIEGLRKSKLSYRPIFMLKKHSVEIM